jgi:hypothetical protein
MSDNPKRPRGKPPGTKGGGRPPSEPTKIRAFRLTAPEWAEFDKAPGATRADKLRGLINKKPQDFGVTPDTRNITKQKCERSQNMAALTVAIGAGDPLDPCINPPSRR